MRGGDSINSVDMQRTRTIIERAFEPGFEDDEPTEGEVRKAVEILLEFLENGRIRAAEPHGHRWLVNVWVKKGLLIGLGMNDLLSSDSGFFLGSNLPDRSSCRIGLGAYLDEDVIVEPDVLIGVCAQIGKRVHLSAAVKLGGMLEPVEDSPVIIEDDVFLGGGCGIYDGAVVRRRAVLAAGVTLTRSTSIYDVVKGDVLHRVDNRAPEIPEGAIVVTGTRRVDGEWGAVHGLGVQCNIIIGYRDEVKDADQALMEGLG